MVREHLSGVQAIDNACIANARKVAKACMSENQRDMRKVYHDHLAKTKAAEEARIAKERIAKAKKYKRKCCQCSKVFPGMQCEAEFD